MSRGFSQKDLEHWPQGLSYPAAVLRLEPAELTNHYRLRFAESHDDLDRFVAALVETEEGSNFALVRHIGAPGPGTEVWIDEECDDPRNQLAKLLDALDLDETDLTWVAPWAGHSRSQGAGDGDRKPPGTAEGERFSTSKPQTSLLPWDFLICYVGEDREWASWIERQLETAGCSVISQKWDELPGRNFELMMSRAVVARQTILILSGEFLDADRRQPKWLAGIRNDPVQMSRRFLAVRVRPCEPLRGAELVDLTDLTEEEAALRLLRRIAPFGKAPPVMPPGIATGAKRRGGPPFLPSDRIAA